MSQKTPLSRGQRTTILYGILCFVMILVICQLWLLTATMNAYLGGDLTVIWPAAVVSLACLGLNVGLLYYVYAMERTMTSSTASAARFTPAGNPLQLTLASGAFAACFAIFGSISAMMPVIKQQLQLTPVQVSLAIALPVILGSLGRIPLGMLTDRFGGRRVFAAVMLASIIPTVLLGWVDRYWALLLCGFFIGIALASFAVGVGFVSRWYPPHKQGSALGIYGAGTIGQSLAAFGSPLVAAALGYAWGFWVFGVVAFLWLALFLALAKDAPRLGPAKSLADMLQPLSNRRAWLLGIYYFLTFGGFVAMSIYLPILLTEMFGITAQDAGFRTAGFIVLATVMRPVGGALADRVGGRTILLWVFPATAVMALFMACPSITTFTVGALGMATAIGLGNGAVFKLVPEFFPTAVGSVTGLVGAAGGLGGFFPPLVLGLIREYTGDYTWGFVLLTLTAGLCFVLTKWQPRETRSFVVAAT